MLPPNLVMHVVRITYRPKGKKGSIYDANRSGRNPFYFSYLRVLNVDDLSRHQVACISL